MTKTAKNVSKLAAATLALDERLELFEQLAAAAQRLPLNSEKNIERATRAIKESTDCQQEVLSDIHALIQALTAARERNQLTADSLQARRDEVQKRNDELSNLLLRFTALGQEARDISASVAHLREGDLDAPSAREITFAELQSVGGRMARVADDASELTQAANTAGLADLGGQADSLRQQVHAARNKLTLLVQRLCERNLTLS